MSWSEVLGEGGEVRKNFRPRRQAAFIAGLFPLAREYQHRTRAGGSGGLCVLQRIAHHVHILQRYVEAPRGFEKHAGLGLAALAARVRRVRAKEEGIDAPAGLAGSALQRLVDLEERARREEAARDARLIGSDDDAVARLRKAGDGLHRALDRPPLFQRLDVMVAVVVDGAVAIQDDELHVASLDRSAMRFMVPCSRPRNPMRFARTFGSLSITITLSKNASTGAFSDASDLNAPV